LCNGDETQKLWKPLLTQFSLSEAHRNGLHNGLHPYIFFNLPQHLPLADRPRKKENPYPANHQIRISSILYTLLG